MRFLFHKNKELLPRQQQKQKMAIFHSSTQMVKRSEGKSSIAMSAYRAGEKLTDYATGEVKDFTLKTKVFGTHIFTPVDAPEWMTDRETLWNEVERAEKRKDAQLAREQNIALPVELSNDRKIELAETYINKNFVSEGMVADTNYHDFFTGNPHAHIMLTTREIDGDGFSKKKNREWNNKKLITKWRKSLADLTNQFLAEDGFKERVDHRSLADQGIDRIPQIHVGVTCRAEKPSIRTLRNEDIKDKNYRLAVAKEQLKQVNKEIFRNGLLETSGKFSDYKQGINPVSLSIVRFRNVDGRRPPEGQEDNAIRVFNSKTGNLDDDRKVEGNPNPNGNGEPNRLPTSHRGTPEDSKLPENRANPSVQTTEWNIDERETVVRVSSGQVPGRRVEDEAERKARFKKNLKARREEDQNKVISKSTFEMTRSEFREFYKENQFKLPPEIQEDFEKHYQPSNTNKMQAGLADGRYEDEVDFIHEQSVEVALSEGEKVSQDVLRDYPKLGSQEKKIELTGDSEQDEGRGMSM